MLFFLRLLKHLFMFLCILLPLEILGWLVLLPVVYSQTVGTMALPRYLRWFDNADQFIGRDTSTYYGVAKSGKWNRYVWLAFRNPLNYFGYKILGVEVVEPPKLEDVWVHGDAITLTEVGDRKGEKSGVYYVEITIAGKTYYEYHTIQKWSTTKCLRFRMGHKICDPSSNTTGSIIQWVFVLQPYKDYAGV